MAVVQPHLLVFRELGEQSSEDLRRALVLPQEVVRRGLQRAVEETVRLQRQQPLEQRQHGVRLLLGIQNPGQIVTRMAVPGCELKTLPEKALGFGTVVALGRDGREHAHRRHILW